MSSNDCLPYTSPILLLEELFSQFEWTYECTSDVEFTAEVEGRWCTYRFMAVWMQEMDSLMVGALIDLQIPPEKVANVNILLSSMNPRVWLGHFEIAPDDEIPAFRYNFSLRGSVGPAPEQIEDIVTSAIMECDRLYPALQFLLWGGKSPEEALEAAMLDTLGDA